MMRRVSLPRQDVGVRLATPLGPVIHAEHRDLADLRMGQRPDQPDQRALGHDRAQDAGQPDPARPASASATRPGRFRDPVVRRWCLAVSPSTCSANVTTTQAALPQMNRRTWSTAWTGRPQQARSCRATPVAAVHPWCRLAALRAGRRRRARARHEPDQIAPVLHPVQLQAGQAGEQQAGQAGFLSGQLMPHNRPPRTARYKIAITPCSPSSATNPR
jgi:hypothetical protein